MLGMIQAVIWILLKRGFARWPVTRFPVEYKDRQFVSARAQRANGQTLL